MVVRPDTRHGLALTARAGPPRRYGALVNPQSGHNRLQGTPMGEQGHHDDHGLCRGAQPIEDRTFAGAEGLLTLVADKRCSLREWIPLLPIPVCLWHGSAMGADTVVGSMRCSFWLCVEACQEEYVGIPIFTTSALHHGSGSATPLTGQPVEPESRHERCEEGPRSSPMGGPRCQRSTCLTLCPKTGEPQRADGARR